MTESEPLLLIYPKYFILFYSVGIIHLFHLIEIINKKIIVRSLSTQWRIQIYSIQFIVLYSKTFIFLNRVAHTQSRLFRLIIHPTKSFHISLKRTFFFFSFIVMQSPDECLFLNKIHETRRRINSAFTIFNKRNIIFEKIIII